MFFIVVPMCLLWPVLLLFYQYKKLFFLIKVVRYIVKIIPGPFSSPVLLLQMKVKSSLHKNPRERCGASVNKKSIHGKKRI